MEEGLCIDVVFLETRLGPVFDKPVVFFKDGHLQAGTEFVSHQVREPLNSQHFSVFEMSKNTYSKD